MAFTQAELDALRSAYATGALEVEYGSGETRRRVRYASREDLEARIDQIERALAGTSGESRGILTSYTGE